MTTASLVQLSENFWGIAHPSRGLFYRLTVSVGLTVLALIANGPVDLRVVQQLPDAINIPRRCAVRVLMQKDSAALQLGLVQFTATTQVHFSFCLSPLDFLVCPAILNFVDVLPSTEERAWWTSDKKHWPFTS